MRLAGNAAFGSSCWIFACRTNKAGRVLRRRANLLPAQERSITAGWCFLTHPSPAPLLWGPGPPGDGSRASPSPSPVSFPDFPHLPQLRFPQTKHPPGFQPFTLSRRQDLGIHSSPSWAGGCSRGPNDTAAGWGGTRRVGVQGWGAPTCRRTGDTPVLFLLGC